MPRLNVYLPDELAATVKRELPDLNVSAALQDTLQRLLRCTHLHAVCAACSKPIPVRSLQEQALDAFYVELIDALTRHIRNDGTVAGAGRVAEHVAERHGVPAARWVRVPVSAKHGKRRHPSSGEPLPAAPVAGEADCTGLPDLRAQRRRSA